MHQVKVTKDIDVNVLNSEENLLRRWKEYFEELMNEGNGREKKGSSRWKLWSRELESLVHDIGQ